MATQADLGLRPPRQEVDAAAIRRLSSLTAAVNLCAAISGLPDKTICHLIDMQPSVWTRVKQGECSLTGEQLNMLMDECGNEVPLLWMVNRRGYDVSSLRKLRTELERALETETTKRVAAESELATIKKFLREVKAP